MFLSIKPMQMNKPSSFILLIVLFLVYGCKKNFLPPKEYYNYVINEKNGLKKIKKVDEFIFDLQFEPLDFKIVKQLKKEQINISEYNKLLKEMEGMQYYILKIKVANATESILKYQLQSEEDYQNRLAYFSFNFQSALYLEEDKRQIPCSLFHFERMYDLTPERVFVLGFEQSTKSLYSDKTFVIDSDFFSAGKIKIKIKGNDIKATPKLLLN